MKNNKRRCPICGSTKTTVTNGKITCTDCGMTESIKRGKTIVTD